MDFCENPTFCYKTVLLQQSPLEGKYEIPIVNVITITEEEFSRMAPLGQSYAGQAVPHGVTPEGKGQDLPAGKRARTRGDPGERHLLALPC